MALDFNLLNTNIPAEAASSTMKGMQQVNALTTQRLANDVTSLGMKNALAEQEAYRNSGSLDEAQQNLLRAGQGKSAAALGQSIALQGKTQAQARKFGLESTKTGLEIMRERTKDILGNTSNENYIAHQQEGVRDGLITPDQAQRNIQTFIAISPNQRVSYIQQQLTKAEDLYNTPDIKNFNYGQQDPKFFNYQLTKAKAGANSQQVIMPPQERAEQTERGKFLVDDYKVINTAARIAARTLPAIETNMSLIDKGFETGFTTETKKGAASVLSALGVKDATDFATNAQVFQAKANETVLQRQLEQKGPQTEADAARITQTSAQLGNTTDANKFILGVAKAQIKRDIEQRNYYDKWFTENKTYDGAENAWYNGEGGKSLFERPELKKYNISPKPNTGSQKTNSGLSPAEQAELDSLRTRFKR